MDDEAEAGRELQRLRAELTEFVVDAVSERMASGAQPELSAGLADAIDRRVDKAVGARMADVRWPDPDDFADQVIAAARRSGDGQPRPSGTRKSAGRGGRPGMIPFALGFVTALGIALIGYLIYSALQRPSAVQTNVQAPLVNGVEPTSTGPVNVLVEGGNGATPAPAPANQQAPAR